MTSSKVSLCALAVVMMLVVPKLVSAQILFDVTQTPGPEARSAVYEFPVTLAHPPISLGIRYRARLEQGEVVLRLVAADGTVIHTERLKSDGDVYYALAGPLVTEGDFRFEVALAQAAGEWSVVAMRLPQGASLDSLLAPGPLMLLIAVAFVLGWRLHSRTAWKWFLAGAALWLVGAGIKELWRWGPNDWFLGLLRENVSHGMYIFLGSTCKGLVAGIAEVGVFVIAALAYRPLAKDAGRALSVAIAAGAFRAALLGLFVIVTSIQVFAGEDAKTVVGVGYAMLTTPLFWLLGPARQLISILCQMGVRVVVLYGIAGRRSLSVMLGFVLLTTLECVSSATAFSENAVRYSLWWTEIATLPWALVCFYLTRWCVDRWPMANEDATAYKAGRSGRMT